MFGFFEQKANEIWSVVAPEKSDGEKLFSAVQEGRITDVRYWVQERSIDPNLKNESGNTLLHVAAYHGREDIVHFLVDMGADVRALGGRLNSCLHYAAMEGHQNLVQFFIDKGLSPSAKNQNGKSPYDVAKGFTVKQKLMHLIFQEEADNGTAPVILGASRDKAKDEERLRNLPPPPTLNAVAQPVAHSQGEPQTVNTGNELHPPLQSANQVQQPMPAAPVAAVPPAPIPAALPAAPPAAPPVGQHQDPNYRPSAQVRRAIKENDGFVTTVGNPELAAKYGNKVNYAAPTPQAENVPERKAISPPSYVQRSNTPFSQRGRYVNYDPVSNKASQYNRASAVQQPIRPQTFGQRAGNVNVFNPVQPQHRSPAGQVSAPTPAPTPAATQTAMSGGVSSQAGASPVTTSRFGAPKLNRGGPIAQPLSPARNLARNPPSTSPYGNDAAGNNR
mmetsp:Transcript_3301/g.4408  ORF Transcript_3301/g.4408 Transcript_3301/m.4408 type:complete len:447 (-) Transcript_3301:1081-2421(-)